LANLGARLSDGRKRARAKSAKDAREIVLSRRKRRGI
jgi:hypothetical protein